jgi:hypothetical protein
LNAEEEPDIIVGKPNGGKAQNEVSVGIHLIALPRKDEKSTQRNHFYIFL